MEVPRQMLNTVTLFYKTGPKTFSCFLFKVVDECFPFSFTTSSVASWFSLPWLLLNSSVGGYRGSERHRGLKPPGPASPLPGRPGQVYGAGRGFIQGRLSHEVVTHVTSVCVMSSKCCFYQKTPSRVVQAGPPCACEPFRSGRRRRSPAWQPQSLSSSTRLCIGPAHSPRGLSGCEHGPQDYPRSQTSNCSFFVLPPASFPRLHSAAAPPASSLSADCLGAGLLPCSVTVTPSPRPSSQAEMAVGTKEFSASQKTLPRAWGRAVLAPTPRL